MLVIDDEILNREQQKYLEDLFLSNTFPWFYRENTSSYEDCASNAIIKTSHTQDNPQFTHMFFTTEPQPYFNLMVPFLDFIKYKLNHDRFEFGRIKANLLLKTGFQKQGHYNLPHVDGIGDNIRTLLYYVNDSDGDTVFFNEKYSPDIQNLTINKKISPKAGRCVIFDSSYYHASSPPVVSNERCVINLMFKINESR